MDNSYSQSYSDKVLEHIKHPKNTGEIENPDGVATVGNPVCGDMMRFFIKVGKRKDGAEYIKAAKFQTLGCGAAIASSSIVTTMVKGKPLTEVAKLSKQAIVEALGGLPAMKVHCSVLADEGFKKAIKDYQSKKTGNESKK